MKIYFVFFISKFRTTLTETFASLFSAEDCSETETESSSSSKIRIVSSSFVTGEDDLETLKSVMPSHTAISLRSVAGSQNVIAPRKEAASRIVTQNSAVSPYVTVANNSTASGSITASRNISTATSDVTSSPGVTAARTISANPGQVREVLAPTRLEDGKVVRRIIRLTSRDDIIAELQRELEALKKSLSQQQLSNHKLEFEKKLLKKERDEFEQLLTDSEAAAKRLKADLRTVLSEDFSSVDDLKARAAEILNETDSDPDEVLINEELIKFSDPYTLTDYLD